jgi:class 3 adenylate cyclase
MEIDLESMSLREVLQLEDTLAQTLRRRFGRNAALVFTDVVGSTQYFARFGDQAGRILQQRHLQLLEKAIAKWEGRIVDTAGDGAFSTFPNPTASAEAMVSLEKDIAADNIGRARDHHLQIRAGLHFGPVLTDGIIVSGDAVNLCARVASSSQPGEIRMTKDTFLELTPEIRRRCEPLAAGQFKGIPEPVPLMKLPWMVANDVPDRVRIEETHEVIPIPQQETITFGRLKEKGGVQINDIVLTLPDPVLRQQISRWQFELRRVGDGMVLRSVSDKPTEVDGAAVGKGVDVPVRGGSVLRIVGVMTITFLKPGEADDSEESLGTTIAPSGI